MNLEQSDICKCEEMTVKEICRIIVIEIEQAIAPIKLKKKRIVETIPQ